MVDQKALNEKEEYYEQASYKNFLQQKNSLSNQQQIIYEEDDGLESNKYSESSQQQQAHNQINNNNSWRSHQLPAAVNFSDGNMDLASIGKLSASLKIFEDTIAPEVLKMRNNQGIQHKT